MFAEFARQFTITFVDKGRYMLFAEGFLRTLTIAVFATVIGVALGTAMAIIKVYNYRTGKIKGLRIFADVYLAVFRGTPVVVQLMILYYIVLVNIQSGLVIAVIGFGINSGAYVCEIVRSGIMSVDNGQFEAGCSLGFSEAETMRYIILPQAVKNVLPAMFNELITLLKETSVAGYITVIDLTKAADQIRARTMLAFFPLIAVALIYLVLVMGLTKVQGIMEEKLSKSDRR